jgi:hypothetical protein
VLSSVVRSATCWRRPSRSLIKAKNAAAGLVLKPRPEEISSPFEPSPFWLRRMPNPLAVKARQSRPASRLATEPVQTLTSLGESR